jgi:hypothetical protein
VRKLFVGLTLLGGAALVAPALSASSPPPATFVSYRAPGNLGNGAGEPTLGVEPETQTVLYQAGLQTLAVDGFDGRGGANWVRRSSLTTDITTLDPFVEVDAQTGRAFVSQLALACSQMAFSDDAGRTWTPVPLGCSGGSFFDHQNVGTGPFVKTGVLRPVTSYPNAVYYCSHDSVRATCGTSVDGGLSFGPAVVAYTLGNASGCSTNFGHLKAAPDGTVYLPPNLCRDPGIAVSEDNGLTWRFTRIDGPRVGNAGHPSIGLGSDGTAYFAYGSVDEDEGGPGGPPAVTVSRDKGRTWTDPLVLGREHGIRNTKFVTTVAGDGDRAAVAFLGTRTDGNDQANDFDGVWHLYVSFTYDRGKSWRTVNATPNEPVQVGKICIGGISCSGGTRNLLDFNDVVIDRQGRVLAAIADGCLSRSCDTGDRHEKATIVRQQTGKGLIRAWDGKLR